MPPDLPGHPPLQRAPRCARRIALAVALAGWLGAAAAEPLEVAQASYRTSPREQVFDAVIEAVKQSTVSAQTAGRVLEVNFDVDDLVPKGAVLIRLRDTEQRANLAAASATLREAEARLAEAQAEYRRVRDIHDKKLVAKAALDKADADLKAAGERLEAARANVERAQEQLGYTVITAPYGGVVVKRHVEVGEMAGVGQPLMTGFALDELRATASVPQGMIYRVRQHNRARILAPDARSIAAAGLTFYPYADPDSHAFRVRIALPRGVEGLYPGMLVKAAFTLGEQRLLLIPRQAVVQRSEVSAVYVVDAQGRVSFRQVRTGRGTDDGSIEILAGLEEGEAVALDPIRAGVVLKEQRTDPGTGS